MSEEMSLLEMHQTYQDLREGGNLVDMRILTLRGSCPADDKMGWRLLDMHDLLKAQLELFRWDIRDCDLKLTISFLGGVLRSYEHLLSEIIAVSHPSKLVDGLKEIRTLIERLLNRAGHLAW